MDMPVEVFRSASALPKDPILRKQHLEELMTKIHGSFSFMQVGFGLHISVWYYCIVGFSALPVTEGLLLCLFLMLSCSGLSPRW